MHKPKHIPPNTPKAIKRRYQRRTAPWWSAVIVLAGCAVWSAFSLLELFFPIKSSDLVTTRQREGMFWLILPLILLRLLGFGDYATKVILIVVLVGSTLSACAITLLLFRLAPEGYWEAKKARPRH